MAKCGSTRLEGISREIWEMKYRYVPADGNGGDACIEDTWRRVARAAASVEASQERKRWERAFLDILEDFRFLPGGRILAGAGTGRQVTLFNCFVMGEIEDSIAGIFDNLKESALTMQAGGGIGLDFSPIRPRGAEVRGIDAKASGPLGFMEVWDAMCRTIMSAGARRGAMMGTLSCEHPDLEDFISAKRERGRLTNFNMSVLVTDAFMEAVRNDAEWPLTFGGRTWRTVPARRLWDAIMRSTYDHAEPGVIFIDRVNRDNNLGWIETIHATNPCGEQPLPPYGACLLGSLNLVRFVRNPFDEGARLDEEELERAAAVAVRFLDNVIDVSTYPLPRQQAEARAKRRIGLGITGLADALAMCGLRYDTPQAVETAERWMAVIERAAYLTSTELAQEKGAFPLFDADRYLACGHVSRMDAEIRQAVARRGIRNALLTSIAPTGTISLLAGNVSSGIERDRHRLGGAPLSGIEGTGRPAARRLRNRPGAALEGARGHAGGHPETCRFGHLEDRQSAPRHPFRGVPGRLHGGLESRPEGLHHLPSQSGHGIRSLHTGQGRRGKRIGKDGSPRATVPATGSPATPTPYTSPSTTSRKTAAGARSKFSSIPGTWSITPGRSHSPA